MAESIDTKARRIHTRLKELTEFEGADLNTIAHTFGWSLGEFQARGMTKADIVALVLATLSDTALNGEHAQLVRDNAVLSLECFEQALEKAGKKLG